MYGYPATGKTLTSRKLENRLKEKYSTITLSTLDFRKKLNLFDLKSDAQRDLVYTLLSKKVEQLINKRSHEIVIVDGNFNNKKRREGLYSILNDAEFYIIHCFVLKDKIIEERMKIRQKEIHIPENKAATMDLYYFIKNSGDDFMDDEFVKKGGVRIIHFDSENNSLTEINSKKENKTQDPIERIVNVLEE